jgi:hypothetical protein
MHKEQHRQHHLKSNNIISELTIIVLSIVIVTGISLIPALQIGVNGQVQQQQQQQPKQQNQVGLSQVIKQIAQQVANANPGTNATHVQQILVQLAKQTALTASKEQAIQEIRQIFSQIAKFPFGTVSQSLAHFAQQAASGNSNVVQIVQQTAQEKAGRGDGAGSSSKNITQTLSNTAVQQATGGSNNVNQVIRQAAQILANRAGVPVEKVEAVIIQIVLQIAQAQGRAITGQYIFQLANQIIQNPNGVLAQAILQLVNQDDGGKSSHTTTIIKNVIKIRGGGGGDNGDNGKPPSKCKPGYHWDDKLKKCVPNSPPPPPPCDPKTQNCPAPPPPPPPDCTKTPKPPGCPPDPEPPSCEDDPTAEGCEDPEPIEDLDDGDGGDEGGDEGGDDGGGDDDGGDGDDDEGEDEG